MTGRASGTGSTHALGSLGLDAAEHGVLAIARYYCIAFAEPRTEAWRRAIAISLSRFGAEDGPHLAVTVLALMQSRREARQSPFSFNSPTCVHCSCHATPTERALLSVLRAARRGDRRAAWAHAVLLCEGNPAEALVDAATMLASRLDAQTAGHGVPLDARLAT